MWSWTVILISYRYICFKILPPNSAYQTHTSVNAQTPLVLNGSGSFAPMVILLISRVQIETTSNSVLSHGSEAIWKSWTASVSVPVGFLLWPGLICSAVLPLITSDSALINFFKLLLLFFILFQSPPENGTLNDNKGSLILSYYY